MPDKRIQAGRLVLLIVVLCVATPVAQVVEPHTVGLLIIAGVLTALAVVFVVAMPFVIQTASWALAKTLPTPAARRNQMWPKRAWHRVMALSLLAFGLGWLGAFPVDTLADDPHYEDGAMFTDIATGGYIVVATGFLTAAVSTLLTQMASVYENRGVGPLPAENGCTAHLRGTGRRLGDPWPAGAGNRPNRGVGLLFRRVDVHARDVPGRAPG
ncbi:hypothetical protein [Corynebacterium sp.]|uniref:hypothetical protein n=1 Tax=Corynebacterium sp. TaxID=1720 RepID=UPI003735F28A